MLAALNRLLEEPRAALYQELRERLGTPTQGKFVVVDAGSGTGLTTALARHWFPRSMADIVGVDQALPSLEIASKREIDGAAFWNADLNQLALPPGGTDLCIAGLVAGHLPDRPRWFAQTADLLRPGGLLALQDFDGVDVEADEFPTKDRWVGDALKDYRKNFETLWRLKGMDVNPAAAMLPEIKALTNMRLVSDKVFVVDAPLQEFRPVMQEKVDGLKTAWLQLADDGLVARDFADAKVGELEAADVALDYIDPKKGLHPIQRQVGLMRYRISNRILEKKHLSQS